MFLCFKKSHLHVFLYTFYFFNTASFYFIYKHKAVLWKISYNVNFSNKF